MVLHECFASAIVFRRLAVEIHYIDIFFFASLNKEALPQIEWVDYRCSAEFIRPTACIWMTDDR